MTVRRISVLFLALFICIVDRAEAQTITAASCNASDVQKAFNSMVASTTTVNIPSGTCTWTTQVTLTVPSGSTTLSVLGAGSLTTTGGGDQTVLIDNINRSSTDMPMLSVTALSGAAELRIAGITFETNGSSQESYNGSVVFSSSTTSTALVRIDHSHFALTADGKQAQVGGCVYGVMDHSILDLTQASTNNGFFLNQNTCGGSSPGVGNGQWNQATNPGSEQSFYFENDVFNGGTNTSGSGSTIAPFANDCSGGGRFVYRFNTFNGVRIQGHATGHSNNPPDRGCRAMEIYKNSWAGTAVTNANNPNESALYWTSGTGLMWGNTVTESMKNFVEAFVDRVSNATYTQSAPPAGWGYCGTAYGPSAWDENLNSTGRACLDGIGRGVGDLLTGSFPTVCDSTLGCGTYNGQWPNQASEPVYEWLDAFTTASGWGGVLWGEQDSVTLQNADYYLNSDSGSGANCTGFTGATGVGCGTRASRPSTCTTGVAYWSTDQGSWNSSGSGGQGVLDKCTATNTWTNAWYTPYAYPHPLDTGQAGPAPPVSVKAVVP